MVVVYIVCLNDWEYTIGQYCSKHQGVRGKYKSVNCWKAVIELSDLLCWDESRREKKLSRVRGCGVFYTQPWKLQAPPKVLSVLTILCTYMSQLH
jgi:hypothetical protein